MAVKPYSVKFFFYYVALDDNRSLNLKKKFFFNWRRIALRYCVVFCHTTMQVSRNYTYITCLPSSHPSRSSDCQAGVPALYSSFQPAIYFTRGSVCMSALLSPFVPPSPSLIVCISPFSTSASLFLPCKHVHQYHFSRFHICSLIHCICFFLSSLLHSV